MNLSSIVAGIDVSKAKLDVYIHPLSKYRTFDNKEQGFEEILNFLKQHNVTKVAFEATGGYEKLCAYLQQRPNWIVLVMMRKYYSSKEQAINRIR